MVGELSSKELHIYTGPKPESEGIPHSIWINPADGLPYEFRDGDWKQFSLVSRPPRGAQFKKVINIYVEIVNGQPKVKVEFEE